LCAPAATLAANDGFVFFMGSWAIISHKISQKSRIGSAKFVFLVNFQKNNGFMGIRNHSTRWFSDLVVELLVNMEKLPTRENVIVFFV